ncbi:helix-turn-helix transcriptional regulator [Streptomyces sp. BPTC-684]|uniref:helix-turn-helix domain-containing protein n=1 Tax=Streptomyces sp. BPTC-684 TaxID=3043734 RepID=UPI0024B1AFB6|nr:helix-turn-helix transcriptional regulator [Streptomyces sp. BPTC-684]WHM37027.1 helix-turn-helix transcriptional regulator [Streptomyces sp. BPTC-684]
MVARARELTPDRSAHHLFGSEQRRHREAAGMSLERLAGIVKYSKSALARFETAESMIPPDLPAKLDAAFGTDRLFENLYSLARKEIHPDQFRRRMELEARAQLIQEYTCQIVPGLLQTEEYARAQFVEHNPKASSEAINELVTARMGRQALLDGEPAPDYSVILDEAVLHRGFGGPTVMRVQLARLARSALTPSSTLQVLPFTHGGHALVGGSLTLMTLEGGTQVAYEESITTGTLLEESEVVTERRRAYDRLTAHVLPPRDSAEFVRSVMEALPT